MIRSLQQNSGASLVEQLMALFVGAVVVTALSQLYRAELYHHLEQQTRTASLQDARGALHIMIGDLKNAGSWGTGSAPAELGGADDPDGDADSICNRVYAATASMVHVQMDLNANGNCADTVPRENIRYELTAPTATCPGPKIIRRNGDCLVANVTTPLPGQLFTYYGSAGVDLGATPPRDAIKRIRIAFAVEVANPDPKKGGKLTTMVSNSVDLRN